MMAAFASSGVPASNSLAMPDWLLFQPMPSEVSMTPMRTIQNAGVLSACDAFTPRVCLDSPESFSFGS